MSQSEVAQFRQQIEIELTAMRRGLYGVAAGTARHAFIHARMENIGLCQDQLAHTVGDAEARLLVCELYMRTMEHDEPELVGI
ncbi:hypothetical protein [Tengunoibacter tsumagoiensis]|uniref:Uncharacterized protein n=1 Tax=Tengunoibacter tsumagoiensis TaxID=2014871 RepID=A0A402A603_9CHLR|nr:hypothetical protein [Tengunoibacter tsumagoiensis]GCE14573.1 hypothetical protein KTT_44320 [Tengunoibacter tsumagoiensis]